MTKGRAIALAGAMAGAVALAGCATLEEAAVQATSSTYHATLTGAQEVGGGDPDGAGRAEVSISDGFNQVCWDINSISNLDTVTAAHIHRGARGVNGPPVFTLTKSNEGDWKGCADGSQWTQDRISNNPEMFYVNVHTTRYPNGAIRGQLGR